MSAPTYRLVQQFLRLEALGMRGARHGDPADPLKLQVVVSDADDLDVIVEQVIHGPSTEDKIWRLTTGRWAFQLDPGLYQSGKAYSARWRFEMTPGNVNVARQNFTWRPVPALPHDEGSCVIFGTMTDIAKMPVADARLVVEQYDDVITRSKRVGTVDVTTDAFGLWHLELPRKSLVRFVFGNLSKVIQVPELARAALHQLPDYQPMDILRVDRFGYPIPGQDLLLRFLQSRLSAAQAQALLRSMSVEQVHSFNQDVAAGSVGFFTHDQTDPSTVWELNHNSDCYPIVAVMDDAGTLVMPDVQYPTNDSVILSFGKPATGKAVLLCGQNGQAI